MGIESVICRKRLDEERGLPWVCTCPNCNGTREQSKPEIEGKGEDAVSILRVDEKRRDGNYQRVRAIILRQATGEALQIADDLPAARRWAQIQEYINRQIAGVLNNLDAFTGAPVSSFAAFISRSTAKGAVLPLSPRPRRS